MRNAIREGRGVGRREAARIAQRYADRLLQLRGEIIARTETLQAVHAGAYEAMQQLIDTGGVRASQVRKVWQATPDARTRDPHRQMHGESVPFDQPFRSPTGALLRYPGDTALGAGAADVVNCRCWVMMRIDYLPNS
ncbi:MAG: phage minor head protein [Pseudomonadota bacterium]